MDELDARGCGSRSEDEDATRCAGVGDAGCSRGVGADDHEVDVALGGEPCDSRCIGHVDRDVLGDRRGATVAGRHDQLQVRRVAQTRPRQRVLATPGSDDEDSPYSHSMVDGGLLEMS